MHLSTSANTSSNPTSFGSFPSASTSASLAASSPVSFARCAGSHWVRMWFDKRIVICCSTAWIPSLDGSYSSSGSPAPRLSHQPCSHLRSIS
eukprot:scaffold4024_cov222-Pinguiococcus_pyrenoidosus.AAC.4